jgi:hypothetical protein
LCKQDALAAGSARTDLRTVGSETTEDPGKIRSARFLSFLFPSSQGTLTYPGDLSALNGSHFQVNPLLLDLFAKVAGLGLK